MIEISIFHKDTDRLRAIVSERVRELCLPIIMIHVETPL
jgi:hypothetical protein